MTLMDWGRVGHRHMHVPGTAHARPLPARLHDSDAQRSCIGTCGGWADNAPLSLRPEEVDTSVLPFFRTIWFKPWKLLPDG